MKFSANSNVSSASDWGRHRVSTVGRLCVSIVLIFTCQWMLGYLGAPYSGVFGLAIVLLGEGVWALWKSRRLARLKEASSSLQQTLHQLRQEEFELRLSEARRSGRLDQWKKDE